MARNKLSDLTEAVRDEEFIILTKEGVPRAALVDIAYLSKLQERLQKIHKKTYIDPQLFPLTREFSDQETLEWERQNSV